MKSNVQVSHKSKIRKLVDSLLQEEPVLDPMQPGETLAGFVQRRRKKLAKQRRQVST